MIRRNFIRTMRKHSGTVIHKPEVRAFVPLLVMSALAIIGTLTSMIDADLVKFSSLALGMAKYSLAFSLAWITDKMLVPNNKTSELLSTDAKAYAIFIAANILGAAICFATS
jgi:hypothetical protein